MTETVLDRQTKSKLALNEKWKVIFHNDNVTPIEFVVFLIVHVFNKGIAEAASLAIQVHETGFAVIQEYSSFDIAHEKTSEAKQLITENNQSLKITIEQ